MELGKPAQRGTRALRSKTTMELRLKELRKARGLIGTRDHRVRG